MLCRRQASPPLSSPARSPALSPMNNQTLSPKLSPRPSPTLSPKVSPSLSPRPSPTLSPKLSPTSTVRRRVVFRCFFARRLRPRLLHDQTSSSAREIPTGFPISSTLRSPQLSPALSPEVSPKISPTISPALSPRARPALSPRASPTLSPRSSPTRIPFLTSALFMRCCHFGFWDRSGACKLDAVVLLFSSTTSRRMLPNPTLGPMISPVLASVSPTISPALSPMSIPATSHLTRGGQESLLAFPLLWCDCCVVLPLPNSHPMNPPSTMFRARNAVTLEREKENREYSSVLIARLASMPMRMAGNRTAQRS